MRRRWWLLAAVTVVTAAACVPTIDETITINADGSGQFTATWFVTRDDFDAGGRSADADGALGGLEFDELKETLSASRPERLIVRLFGDENYRLPPRANLVSLDDDDRLGIVYRESFSSLSQLQSWRRDNGPLNSLAGPADPESGRLSLLALWGLQVEETPEQTTLTIEPASAFAAESLAGVAEGQVVDTVRLRLAISVEGEVLDSNADRVEGDQHVWEPTVEGSSVDPVAALEPVRLTWQWTPEAEEGNQNTTIAVVLIGLGLVIGLGAFVRYLWSRRFTRPLHYVDE